MKIRFISFFITVVFFSSLYVTLDYKMYMLGNTYDVLLQDTLYVIDYFVISLFLLFYTYPKSTSKKFINSSRLLVVSYLLLFAMGSALAAVLKNLEIEVPLFDLGQTVARILQILAFTFLIDKERLVKFLFKKEKINPIPFSALFILLLGGLTYQSSLTIIHFIVLLILLVTIYQVSARGTRTEWELLAGACLLFGSETAYLFITENDHPVVVLFLLRSFSAAAELLMVKGFTQIVTKH